MASKVLLGVISLYLVGHGLFLAGLLNGDAVSYLKADKIHPVITALYKSTTNYLGGAVPDMLIAHKLRLWGAGIRYRESAGARCCSS